MRVKLSYKKINFGSALVHQKQTLTDKVMSIINSFTDDNPNIFFKHLLNNTNKGKNILDAFIKPKVEKIIKNVGNFFNKSPSKFKPAVLSTIATEITPKNLKDYGFNIHNQKVYKARSMNLSDKASLYPTPKHISKSKKPISEDVKEAIVEFTLSKSRINSEAYSNTSKLSNYGISNYNTKSTYFLLYSKRKIYNSFTLNHTNIKISQPKFNKLIPKNFWKSKKESAKCPYYEKLKKNEKEINQTNSENNTPQRISSVLTNQYKALQ